MHAAFNLPLISVFVLFLAAIGAAGQEHEKPGEGGAIRIKAIAERTTGGRLEGIARINEGGLVLTSGQGAPSVITLAELARLDVSIEDASEETDSPEPGEALPDPWKSKDVGRTLVPGTTRWSAGKFILSGSPKQEDERFAAFHMVYRPVSGDCEIVARVVSLGNEDEDSHAGIIICDGLTPENRKAVLGVHPHGEKGVSFRRWGYQGGNATEEKLPSLRLPYWVKLVRTGYDVAAYHSPDGRRWRLVKVSPGRMRDDNVYLGLAARMQKHNRLSKAVIDSVRINGEGEESGEALLPHVILRSGSRVAAELVKADQTAFHLGGRWEGTAVTNPRVARVEFFHPLQDELQKLVQGDRAGLLLRSGDFSETTFESLAEGKVRAGSVLFGSREYSVLDDLDCLVLRKVAEAAARYRVETQAGSVLLAQKAELAGSKLVLEVAGLGEVRFGIEELRRVERL